jgi:acyl-CoA reductase-like NAD-dependent aldehyde dehydrogenase
MYTVTDPATGELIEKIENATDGEVREAIDRVHREYSSWRRRPVAERAKSVSRAGGPVRRARRRAGGDHDVRAFRSKPDNR